MATKPDYSAMSDEQLEMTTSRRPKANLAGFVADKLTGAGSAADAAQAEIQRRAEAAAASRGAAKRAQQAQQATADITFKKGGAVKGWGKARGARAAKIK